MSLEDNVFDSEKENKKLSADNQRVRQKEIDDIRKILKTPEGRRYMWRQLGLCGIFRNSFNLNSQQTAFSEGQRNIGLALLTDINEADSTVFGKMQNEHISALKSRKESQDA